jgi:hypothetical protein
MRLDIPKIIVPNWAKVASAPVALSHSVKTKEDLAQESEAFEIDRPGRAYGIWDTGRRRCARIK